jgi:transcriptional regulator with XRE-family HTH domain
MPKDTPDVEVNFDIGTQLKKLRGKDITQKKLAERAGVSLTLVQKLEQGTRQASLTTLHKLASALDVEGCELLAKKTNLPEPTEDSACCLTCLLLLGLGCGDRFGDLSYLAYDCTLGVS